MRRMARKLLLLPILVIALYAVIVDAPAAPKWGTPAQSSYQAPTYTVPAYPAIQHRPYGVGTGRKMK